MCTRRDFAKLVLRDNLEDARKYSPYMGITLVTGHFTPCGGDEYKSGRPAVKEVRRCLNYAQAALA